MADDANEEPYRANKENMLPCLVPHVGMKFKNPEEGWKFLLASGGQTGFDVRKRYSNPNKIDGKIRSCRFVCANESRRGKDKRNHNVKCHQAQTRTDCEVRIGLVREKDESYKVYDLNLDHNHELHLPETFHLMVSQRKIPDLQAFEIETTDDSGIGPKASHKRYGKKQAMARGKSLKNIVPSVPSHGY